MGTDLVRKQIILFKMQMVVGERFLPIKFSDKAWKLELSADVYV